MEKDSMNSRTRETTQAHKRVQGVEQVGTEKDKLKKLVASIVHEFKRLKRTRARQSGQHIRTQRQR